MSLAIMMDGILRKELIDELVLLDNNLPKEDYCINPIFACGCHDTYCTGGCEGSCKNGCPGCQGDKM